MTSTKSHSSSSPTTDIRRKDRSELGRSPSLKLADAVVAGRVVRVANFRTVRGRNGAVRRLATRLQGFAGPWDIEVMLVIDGQPVSGLPEGRNGAVLVRYAQRAGRDAADDRLVELLEAADPRGGHRPGVRPGRPWW